MAEPRGLPPAELGPAVGTPTPAELAPAVGSPTLAELAPDVGPPTPTELAPAVGPPSPAGLAPAVGTVLDGTTTLLRLEPGAGSAEVPAPYYENSNPRRDNDSILEVNKLHK